MTSEWMGRYRPLVAALVKHGNMAVNNLKHRTEIVPGVRLSSTEWQVLESVIEHELQVTNMNRLAEEIGIPQSTFSKTVSYLCGLGLVEKYADKRMGGNEIFILQEICGITKKLQ